ncbi:MAG TPA: hypothetical protein VD704_13365 [Gaiellaceae bacterium]|nr:hypothetical protein [Gaiellaceae bacterium]
MAKLRFTITMSLDGYVAGPGQGLEHPLGEGQGGTTFHFVTDGVEAALARTFGS